MCRNHVSETCIKVSKKNSRPLSVGISTASGSCRPLAAWSLLPRQEQEDTVLGAGTGAPPPWSIAMAVPFWPSPRIDVVALTGALLSYTANTMLPCLCCLRESGLRTREKVPGRGWSRQPPARGRGHRCGRLMFCGLGFLSR